MIRLLDCLHGGRGEVGGGGGWGFIISKLYSALITGSLPSICSLLCMQAGYAFIRLCTCME